MLVSVRYEKARIDSESYRHDFRIGRQPSYIDSNKTEYNKTVFRDQSNSESLAENLSIEASIIEKTSQVKCNRKWQKNSPHFYDGIITFDKNFHFKQNKIDREQLDRSACDFLKKWCEKTKVKLMYLVRHEDETTTHYHFKTTAQNIETGKSVARTVNDATYKTETQDMAGLSFEPLGIKRGIKIIERLKKAAQERNKDDTSDNFTDYDSDTIKRANVVHRSVRELHEDLPKELSKKRK